MNAGARAEVISKITHQEKHMTNEQQPADQPLMKCICTGEGSGCTNRCDRGQLPSIPAETITIRKPADQKCACQIELEAMGAHSATDFDYTKACHCAAYPESEQCQCEFCQRRLAAGKKPADQGRGVGESRESRMVVVQRDSAGTPIVWCDPEIVDLVTALNAGGIPTVASCSGHGAILGNIALRDGRELHISPSYAAARELEAAIAALTQPKGGECTRSSIFSEQCYCRMCVPIPTGSDLLKLLTLVVDGAKALGHHSTLRETDQATIDYWENYVSDGTEKIKATLAALSLPRQSEAEPFVWMHGDVFQKIHDGKQSVWTNVYVKVDPEIAASGTLVPLYTTPPAAQGDASLSAIEREALEGLIMVAYNAWGLADNAEETDEGHNVDATDFQQLSDALDRLDALPDDQPGYTMSEAAKARWALRRLLEATPQPAQADTTPAAQGEVDIYEACKSWPEDIRSKLSLHDLRRMSGWAPRPDPADWRIDNSAGGPILVYQNCSVIEGETAHYVLGLIAKDALMPATPVVGEP